MSVNNADQGGLLDDKKAKDCPCKKVKCERHGKCDECRAHHEQSGRPRPCERASDRTKRRKR